MPDALIATRNLAPGNCSTMYNNYCWPLCVGNTLHSRHVGGDHREAQSHQKVSHPSGPDEDRLQRARDVEENGRDAARAKKPRHYW